MTRSRKNRGSILIYALWSLGILSVLAVQVGVLSRQKIKFISHLEKRSQLNQIAQSGVKKAVAVIEDNFVEEGTEMLTINKFNRHGDNRNFSDVKLGNGYFEVSYLVYDSSEDNQLVRQYGVSGEDGKLNINKAGRDEVQRLFQVVLGLEEDESVELTEAVLDWREGIGKSSEKGGFFSDDFYQGQLHPYEPKKGPFEMLDELALVAGMSPERVQRLLNFVTIYGDNTVNINSASRPVLIALGLSEPVVDRLIDFRRGPDKREATLDDFIFVKTNLIVNNLKVYTKMTDDEIAEIDKLNIVRRLSTRPNSDYYTISAFAWGHLSQAKKAIRCVYDTREHKIIYWRET